MSEWRNCKLGDVVTIVDCEHKTASLVNKSEYISVRTSNISNGKIDFDKSNRVSKDTYDEWTRRLQPQENDIILAREAPVGEVGWIPFGKKVCLGQRTVLIRVKDEVIEPKYLLYYLVSDEVKFDLISRSTGSVVEHLNVKDIRGFELNIHSNLFEQKAIASILSSLDDKIDLLHRQNTTLEAMAETLFRQWFVEEAKEEWEDGKLEQLVSCINGVSYKSEDLNPSQTAMVTLKSFDRTGGFKIDGFKQFTGKYKPHHVVREGDLVVAHTDITQDAEVIGNPVLVISDPRFDILVISMDLVKVVPKHPHISNAFLYLLMKAREFKEHCLGHSNGSTVLHLSKKAIPSFELKIPPIERIVDFTKIVKPLIDKQYKNQTQIRTLSSLRDTVLPKLMSGELKVNV